MSPRDFQGYTHPAAAKCDLSCGFALFAVTISLFVLGLIAAAVMRTTLTSAQFINAEELQSRAQYAALSGTELGVYDALASLAITPNGTVRNYTVGDNPVIVRMSDEAGRIDINEANEATLSAAFAALGATPSAASQLAAAIADWRDADDNAQPDGAEFSAYQVLGLTYGPRNAPFETLGELRQVRGMTDRMFACALPVFTVYGDSDTVNFDVASQDILNVFAWAEANNWLGEDWSVDPGAGGADIQIVRSDGSGTTLRMDILVTIATRVFAYRAVVRLSRTDRLPFEFLSFSPTAPNQQPQPCWP